METTIFVCGIIILLIGYIAARIEFNKKLKSAKTKAYWSGFEDGFDDALKDAGAVRRAYIFHFETRK